MTNSLSLGEDLLKVRNLHVLLKMSHLSAHVVDRVLLALENIGGSIGDIDTFLGDETLADKAFGEFAESIVGAPLLRYLHHPIDLGGPIDVHLDVARICSENRISLRGGDKAFTGESISLGQPGKYVHRLHCLERNLSVYDLWGKDVLPPGVEFAGWQELLTFATCIRSTPLCAYDVFAPGSYFVGRRGKRVAPFLNSHSFRAVGDLNFNWHEYDESWRFRDRRRFYLVRVYHESPSA